MSRAREAVLDAHFLVLASDLGKEKAKQLRSDLNSFDMLRYVETLVSSKLQNLNKKCFICHILYNYLCCLLYPCAFFTVFFALRFLQRDLTKLNMTAELGGGILVGSLEQFRNL